MSNGRSELLAYGENIYSQAGEDGILAEVCRRLGMGCGPFTYVDVGAHDGRFMSNTERLRECGWRGVCLDSNEQRCQEARRNLARFPGNTVSCVEVTPENVAGLTDWYVNFVDLDVDGPELQIWRAMPSLPWLVLAEIDPLDPLGVMREHSAQKRLSSFSSMVACGESKGYRLIAYTGLNCLFALEAIAKTVLGTVPDADRLYLNGASSSHYRQLVKIRSDARAQLRDWSVAYC
jgi:hypothetical protein